MRRQPVIFNRHIYILLFLIITFHTASGSLPESYLCYKCLRHQLVDLAQQHPALLQVNSLVRNAQQREIWLARLSAGSPETDRQRPAMLVVAGFEGNDLVGTTITMAWIKKLIQGYDQQAEITDLLQTTTIYVIPRCNPDAIEHFFQSPLNERLTNDSPVDDDRDDLKDEDGPEDLNEDGVISWMRIEDPTGDYIQDSEEARLLVKADPLKAQKGNWRYLTEGIDNDQDEQWNEDGPGGVNLNRNFPYNYSYFAPDSGIHQMSEIETKALADFVITHPQIGLFVTYGAADNLLKTPTGKEPKHRQPLTDLDKEDVGYYQRFGKLYRQTLGLKKELNGKSQPGSFSDWMYYHRGRLSLAICPWSPPLAINMFTEEPTDKVSTAPNDCNTVAEDVNAPSNKKTNEELPGDPEARKQLAWFDKHVPDAFIPWTSYDHPDFPNQKVEIGGYRPYVQTNPPIHLLPEIASKQARFLTQAAETLPRIAIRKSTVKHLGNAVFEIEIEVENTGYLPTHLTHGERSRTVYPTRLEWDVPTTAILSGNRITRLKTIPGSGGMTKARFILHCPNQHELHFRVISMLAGQVNGTIALLLNTDNNSPSNKEGNHHD